MREKILTLCSGCSRIFRTSSRRDYCSNACRQRSYRNRKRKKVWLAKRNSTPIANPAVENWHHATVTKSGAIPTN